ncbi:MAG: DUF3108 domain-containing protein [Acidobacteria bacterium]|nr:DUF3108 domain-containing protein [Acidobacteriota bacterium]
MNISLLRSIFFLAVIAVSAIVVSAQLEPGRAFAGETITYEGKVSRLKISVSVAEMTFTATAAPDSKELIVKTDAVSKGTLLRLFRYSFVQNYVSTVDLENFRIVTTTKRDVQKERVRESNALFDYSEKSVTWIETDPKDLNRPPRRIASDLPGNAHDMVSAIYALRMQPLVVGKRFDLTVSDSGLVYRLPVVVTRREQQSTELGKVWCFKIEPEVFGRGRLIEQKGKMVLWVTDDTRRLPVKARIDSQYGKIEIKLKSYRKSAVGASDGTP